MRRYVFVRHMAAPKLIKSSGRPRAIAYSRSIEQPNGNAFDLPILHSMSIKILSILCTLKNQGQLC